MGIYQINLWVCDWCGKKTTTTRTTTPYSDPVVMIEGEEWDYIKINDKIVFACPECLEKYQEPA